MLAPLVRSTICPHICCLSLSGHIHSLCMRATHVAPAALLQPHGLRAEPVVILTHLAAQAHEHFCDRRWSE